MTAQELLVKILPRLNAEPPVGAFLDALQATVGVITRYLLLRRSELLLAEFDEDVAAGEGSLTLPDGFLGFYERPYLGTVQLTKLPRGQRTKHSTAGVPRHYEFIGRTMKLYPATAADISITGSYFAAPATPATMSGDIPWDGMFDDLIGDAVIKIGQMGGWVSITPPFQYIAHNLDILLSRYTQRDFSFVGAEMAPITSSTVK